MRVAFLGNAAWSVPSLEALSASSHEVVLVATRGPKPAGRGNQPLRTPIAQVAERLGLPLAQIRSVKLPDEFEKLRAAAPDVLVVVAYGEILPPAILAVPRRMPVNVHFSLLPELRGAAPVQRAILEGVTATGVTTMRMDEGMDTGPILLQAEEAIDPGDDAGSLGARLAAVGGRLLVDTLDRLEAGALEERPQDDVLATYAPKLKPEERVIDWSRPSDAIARQVRALAPEPGAATAFRGKNLRILAARSYPVIEAGISAGALQPGDVAESRGRGPEEGVSVVTGDGLLKLDRVQPEGRTQMSGGDFARGYRPLVGERLG